MACEHTATEQYAWSTDAGLTAMSVPLCGACSESQQPPETMQIFEVFGVHDCACHGFGPDGFPCDADHEGDE